MNSPDTLERFYLAIIGDIVQSRQIADRGTFQEQFHGTMQFVNKTFAEAIVSPFTVTLGDEFQAILHKADPIFRLRRMLQEKLNPQHIVLGIGVGTIDTRINWVSSVGMDGPALRIARQCVEKAKIHPPRMQFGIQGFPAGLLNCLMHFLETVEKKHSPIQRQVIQLYQKLKNQKLVARRLGVSQPSVSQVLKAAHYSLLQQSEQSIIELLNYFLNSPGYQWVD